MSRTPRIEGENLFYHIFNRGIEKRKIFFNDDDRSLLLDLMFETANEFNVEIHTYALMPNHFHFFIKTLEPNLCRFMHSSMNKFVKSYNRLNERVGRLFQGPYKAIVVDSNEYGHILSRYIHLNWARAYGNKRLSLEKRFNAINEYQWSSYRAFAGRESPQWPVKMKTILNDFGESTEQQHSNYAQYVKEGLLKEINPFADVVAKTILGGDGFVRSIKELLKNSKRHDETANQLALSILAPKISDVIHAVEAEYNTPADLFLTSRPVKNPKFKNVAEARKLFLWTAAKACVGRLTLKQIAFHAGDVSPAAVATARNRVDILKSSSDSINLHCNSILNRLNLSEAALPSDNWSNSFNQLKLYKSKFAHCLVPKDYPPNKSLGSWVAAQKLIFKNLDYSNNPILLHRLERLKSLNPSWIKNINENENENVWNEMFLNLKAFKRLFGNCNVPINWPVNSDLANWVALQRKKYYNKNLDSFCQEKLHDLGLF
ncbi:Helicase associated domain protein [bacterium]|nr:Helicase associated domain protein [bacterium]